MQLFDDKNDYNDLNHAEIAVKVQISAYLFNHYYSSYDGRAG